MSKTTKKAEKKCLPAERLAWLEGKPINIRLRPDPGQEPGLIQATYLDVVLVGRTYFLKFEIGGVNDLINSDYIVEIREA